MKRALLFCAVLLVTAPTTQAQMWCSPGATWHYTFQSAWSDGYYKLYYSGDTVIASQPCKVITKEITYYDFFASVYTTSTFGREYVYEDTDKLYFWRFGSFYPLFDFSASVGDSLIAVGTNEFQDQDTGEPCDSIGYVNVDSTGTVVINGESLRYYVVSPTPTSKWGWSARIVEKIGPYIPHGTWASYFLPMKLDMCGVMLDLPLEAGPFRCYQDNTFGLFTTYDEVCDHTLGEAEKENILQFSVFPNPANDLIVVDPGKTLIYNMAISDMTGKQVQSSGNIQGRKPILLTNLDAGVYFITLTSQNSRCTQKLVVQH